MGALRRGKVWEAMRGLWGEPRGRGKGSPLVGVTAVPGCCGRASGAPELGPERWARRAPVVPHALVLKYQTLLNASDVVFISHACFGDRRRPKKASNTTAPIKIDGITIRHERLLPATAHRLPQHTKTPESVSIS